MTFGIESTGNSESGTVAFSFVAVESCGGGALPPVPEGYCAKAKQQIVITREPGRRSMILQKIRRVSQVNIWDYGTENTLLIFIFWFPSSKNNGAT
jgi:hypothetical protein